LNENVKYAWNPDRIADLVDEVIRIPDPETRYIRGGNYIVALILSKFPDKFIDWAVDKMLTSLPDDTTLQF